MSLLCVYCLGAPRANTETHVQWWSRNKRTNGSNNNNHLRRSNIYTAHPADSVRGLQQPSLSAASSLTTMTAMGASAGPLHSNAVTPNATQPPQLPHQQQQQQQYYQQLQRQQREVKATEFVWTKSCSSEQLKNDWIWHWVRQRWACVREMSGEMKRCALRRDKARAK